MQAKFKFLNQDSIKLMRFISIIPEPGTQALA